jgi:hypothetical protein
LVLNLKRCVLTLVFTKKIFNKKNCQMSNCKHFNIFFQEFVDENENLTYGHAHYVILKEIYTFSLSKHVSPFSNCLLALHGGKSIISVKCLCVFKLLRVSCMIKCCYLISLLIFLHPKWVASLLWFVLACLCLF